MLGLALAIAKGVSNAAAGLLCGNVKIRPGERVCVLVCGAGEDGVKTR